MKIKKGLLINADDYGYKSSTNKAIIESFNKGLINSTSIIANMKGFEEAIDLAHENKLEGNIGVHLVLTEGSSITEQIKRKTFLFNGNLNLSSRLKYLMFASSYTKKLIYNEYSAQIELVKRNGIKITHLDTHHQIHDIWSIVQIMIELLKENNIQYIRILNNLENSTSNYKNMYRNYVNLLLRKKKVDHTRYMGNQQDFLIKQKIKPEILKSSVEVMVHPEYNANNRLIDFIGKNEFDLNFLSDIR